MDDDGAPSDAVDYNIHGYDMARRDRYVDAFVSTDGRRVKVGLVNSVGALATRLRRVAKDCDEPGLREAAHVRVADIDGHEAEDVEAAIRLWRNRERGFNHAGRVDWLDLLGAALEAVDGWRHGPTADRAASARSPTDRNS